MHKQTNQSLDNIDFLQDITPEAAAAYSGGLVETAIKGTISTIGFDPDIIFYTGPNQTGDGYMVRAATGEGLRRLPPGDTLSGVTPGTFGSIQPNDNFESVDVIRGQWLVATDANYGGRRGFARDIGKGEFVPVYNNSISSVARVG